MGLSCPLQRGEVLFGADGAGALGLARAAIYVTSVSCVTASRALPWITHGLHSLRVANEKIRHLEAESKGLLAAAEFREKEACDLEAGTREAQERAHAHQVALANALEQVTPLDVFDPA